MGGFSILNVPDYQRRLDILANKMPFRPGMFLVANDEKLLRVVFDGQIEISETELRIWADRHPEDGTTEIRCRIVGMNPLKVKILEYDIDHEQQVQRENYHKKAEWKRKKAREGRFLG